MEIGETVKVKAYKSDGTCYRCWSVTVEAVEEDRIVVTTPPHHPVEGVAGGWISKYAIRTVYWFDRWYSLLEVYTPDGRLDEIYVNINSPVEIDDSQIRYTDYELDVSRIPPHEARIVDQDDFREAAAQCGYSEAFQRTCYRVAHEAVDVANRWVAGGMPGEDSI